MLKLGQITTRIYDKNREVTVPSHQKIGAGSRGQVFRGKLGTEWVAIKLAFGEPDTDSPDSDVFNDLNVEWEILHQLQHPNIVSVYGMVWCPGQLSSKWLVQELMSHDLETVLRSHTVFKEFTRYDSADNSPINEHRLVEWSLEVVKKLARALRHIHSLGFVHLDLRPSKVLLAASAVRCSPQVKLTGFGCAINLGTSQRVHIPHQIGTYLYMPPEIFEAGAPIYSQQHRLGQPTPGGFVGRAADVFSFSLLVWQTVTREIPFDSFCGTEADRQRDGLRPDANKLPQCLRVLLQQCWDKSPLNRPSFDQIWLDDISVQDLCPPMVTDNLSSTPPSGSCSSDRIHTPEEAVSKSGSNCDVNEHPPHEYSVPVEARHGQQYSRCRLLLPASGSADGGTSDNHTRGNSGECLDRAEAQHRRRAEARIRRDSSTPECSLDAESSEYMNGDAHRKRAWLWRLPYQTVQHPLAISVRISHVEQPPTRSQPGWFSYQAPVYVIIVSCGEDVWQMRYRYSKFIELFKSLKQQVGVLTKADLQMRRPASFFKMFQRSNPGGRSSSEEGGNTSESGVSGDELPTTSPPANIPPSLAISIERQALPAGWSSITAPPGSLSGGSAGGVAFGGAMVNGGGGRFPGRSTRAQSTERRMALASHREEPAGAEVRSVLHTSYTAHRTPYTIHRTPCTTHHKLYATHHAPYACTMHHAYNT
jgi:serine/threonine protein kinase